MEDLVIADDAVLVTALLGISWLALACGVLLWLAMMFGLLCSAAALVGSKGLRTASFTVADVRFLHELHIRLL